MASDQIGGVKARLAHPAPLPKLLSRACRPRLRAEAPSAPQTASEVATTDLAPNARPVRLPTFPHPPDLGKPTGHHQGINSFTGSNTSHPLHRSAPKDLNSGELSLRYRAALSGPSALCRNFRVDVWPVHSALWNCGIAVDVWTCDADMVVHVLVDRAAHFMCKLPIRDPIQSEHVSTNLLYGPVLTRLRPEP